MYVAEIATPRAPDESMNEKARNKTYFMKNAKTHLDNNDYGQSASDYRGRVQSRGFC